LTAPEPATPGASAGDATALRFLAAGEALFDIFVGSERAGTTLMEAQAGGSPFNVAIGLARLSCRTAFLGGIADDPLGERLAAQLRREGVDVSLVRRLKKRTTLSLVALSPEGVPAYAFYGADAADAALTADALPDLPPTIAAIHVGSYATVIQPTGSAIAALVARERGRRVIAYDPNVRPSIEPDLDLWRMTVAGYCRQVQVIKISAEDFGLLYPGEPTERRAADWLAAGVALVVVTHGGDGAEAFTRGGRVSVQGEMVAVIDTLGAGDSFQAALLTGLDSEGLIGTTCGAATPLHGAWHPSPDQLTALLAAANRAAALTCARRGADLPRLTDLAGWSAASGRGAERTGQSAPRTP
jgi:fructokinase